MKKIISFVLVSVLAFSIIISSGAAATAAVKKFPDVPAGAWYANYVNKLANHPNKIIAGYPDGKFHPDDTLQVAHVITMVMRGLGYTDLAYYKGYVDKAIELGIVKKEEFNSYTRAITKSEIAMIIARALIDEDTPDNVNDYIPLIKDYNKIPKSQQPYVLKCYALGIVSGNHGEFGATQKFTRAQAAKMILAMIDETERDIPLLMLGNYTRVNGYIIPDNHTASIDTSSSVTDLTMVVLMDKPLEEQFKEVEIVLKSKFDDAVIGGIIRYVRLKTDENYELKEMIFGCDEYSEYSIHVKGSGWSTTIAVYKN